MAFNENTSEEISIEEAKRLIEAYKTRYPGEINGFFVGSNHLQRILDQKDCMGVRIYSGYDEENKNLTLILVGVDHNEKDMIDGIILDRVGMCPPCIPPNELT